MNAGGISYSGVSGNRKVTLPSVEGWGTNLNILKDPPKSIHTRKIDKVGSTQLVEKMIENSINDRYCENVQVYPRGVNPSVSVSYGNYGYNGGNHGTTMAKYPYRVDIDGDFRPPVLTQTDTLPLSRLPRVTTSMYTNQLAPMWKDRNACDSCVYDRATHDDILHTNVNATATYGMPNEVRHTTLVNNEGYRAINDNYAVTSVTAQNTENYQPTILNQTPTNSVRDLNNIETFTSKTTQQYSKGADGNRSLQTENYVGDNQNISVTSRYSDLANISLADMSDSTFRTRENININATTQKSQNIGTNLENGDKTMRIRELYNSSVHTNQQGEYSKNNLNTSEMELSRTTPLTNININTNGDKMIQHREQYDPTYILESKQNHTSVHTNLNNTCEENQHNIVRDARLHETLSINEGFENHGVRPQVMVDNIEYNLQHNSRGTNNAAYNMMASRNFQ